VIRNFDIGTLYLYLSTQAGHQLSIYCIKELFGRNSPHLASVNSSYKIYEIVVRCWAKIDVRPLHAFFVIPLLSQLWEEKNYCERRNELSSWRPVALPNPHKHLCLFKIGYDVHALLSSVMYILSGKKITAVYPMSRRRWDQNTTQVANRLNRARATYTGRQPPPLSSVLYRIIYKRRSVVAAQVLLREKSGA
jgi:hypothetical protein